MKKLWQTILLTAMGICMTLIMATAVSAATHSGTVETYTRVFSWEADTDSGTLVIEGRAIGAGRTGSTSFPDDQVPWQKWENEIERIVLKGDGSFEITAGSALEESLARTEPVIRCEWGNGFAWEYRFDSEKQVYYGNGSSAENGWSLRFVKDYITEAEPVYEVACIELTDGVKWIPVSNASTLVLGKDAQIPVVDLWYWVDGPDTFVVNADNLYYSAYDGALYSKDYSSLYYANQLDVQFHPDLRFLENRSLRMENGTVVLPWGLLTINGGALARLVDVTVILPDTLTFVNVSNNELAEMRREPYTVTVRFSKNNSEAKAKLTGGGNAYGALIPEIVDSVAEYYPGNSVPVQPVKTGWQLIDQIWYYFNADGSMATNSWVKSGEAWYWLRADGSMSVNEWIDWHGARFRTSRNGVMYFNNWALVDGKWYWFRTDGDMVKDQWIRGKDGKWYYLSSDGSMASSRWIYGKDRKWYYVGSDGVMLTNTRTPDGYYVDANGVWVQ